MTLVLGTTGTDAIKLGDIATAPFVIVGPKTVAFDVITTMERRRAEAAVVVGSPPSGGFDQVLGLITHESIASAVAASIRIYPR